MYIAYWPGIMAPGNGRDRIELCNFRKQLKIIAPSAIALERKEGRCVMCDSNIIIVIVVIFSLWRHPQHQHHPVDWIHPASSSLSWTRTELNSTESNLSWSLEWFLAEEDGRQKVCWAELSCCELYIAAKHNNEMGWDLLLPFLKQNSQNKTQSHIFP